MKKNVHCLSCDFNVPPSLRQYTLVLTGVERDPLARAEGFRARLDHWLERTGAFDKRLAKQPIVLPPQDGKAAVWVMCAEETMMRIERQFASDILRSDPPAQHQRGTVFPPKVDPFDVSKW